MKFKPVYLYIIVFAVLIAVVAVFNYHDNDNNEPVAETKKMNEAEMPNDEIHKGMQGMTNGGTPSAGNVMAEIKQKLANLEVQVNENPNDTLKMREYAEMLAMAHQPQKAFGYFEKILKIDPDRIDILLALTFNYYQTGNYQKADMYNQRILDIDKDYLPAIYNSGAIAAALGNRDKAKEIWSDLVENHAGTTAANMAKDGLSSL